MILHQKTWYSPILMCLVYLVCDLVVPYISDTACFYGCDTNTTKNFQKE